jgi:Fe-S-cluster-containing dehydrogenase component
MAVSEQGGGGSPQTELLRRVPFLAGVDEHDLETLVESSVVRTYQPGQPVVEQGDFGHSMFIVMTGSLSISAQLDDGTRKLLGRLGQPGEFFGEFALLGRGQRSATVHSEQQSTLLEIEKRRFELLTRRYAQVLTDLESIYHQRAISSYLGMHDFFGLLPPDQLGKLIEGATMRKFARNDLVCRLGDPADTVMIVKDGVLKAVRPSSSGDLSILAYFNTHDLVGAGDMLRRGYDLVALGQVEMIYLDRTLFDALEKTAPEIYAKFGKSVMGDDMNADSNTVMGFAASMLKEGVEAESLLIINLDRCVRCGNCVRACHSRHDYTRLARRGPIFKRRKSIESKKHEHILVPGSCRHCRDPECMIGCPTGAIQRFPDGDVGINDNCIGCDNCARKCPYGNISMMPLPEKDQKDGITKKAIKCNLCRGHDYSNCVHECPRGAILRVDPLRYFDELSMVMSAEQQAHLRMKEAASSTSKDESKQRIKPRSTTFVIVSLVLGMLGLAGVVGLFFQSRGPHTGGSPLGLAYGIASAGMIGVALFYGARKKMRNVGLGPLEWWTQFHMVIGVVGFAAALAHAGFQITGVLTALLLLLFGLEVITGVLGQYIYMTVPSKLTRLEKDDQAKLIEDLLEEDISLSASIDELRNSLPAKLQAVANSVRGRALAMKPRLSKSYDRNALLLDITKRVNLEGADMRSRPTLERLIQDLCIHGDVRTQIRLHRSLKNWLVAHLAITGMLVVFLVAHIAAMLMVIG